MQNQMYPTPECETDVIKSGRNLYARIPDKQMKKFGKGDRVKVVMIAESTSRLTDEKLRNEVKKYIYHILVIQICLLLYFPSNYFALGIGILLNLIYLSYLYFF